MSDIALASATTAGSVEAEEDADDLTFFKLQCLVLVLVVGLFGGLLPVQMKRCANSSTLLSLGNSFAGGVFLVAGIVHMLPDAAEGLNKALPQLDGYPLGYCFCTLGLVITLVVDRVFGGHDHGHGVHGAHSHAALIPLSDIETHDDHDHEDQDDLDPGVGHPTPAPTHSSNSNGASGLAALFDPRHLMPYIMALLLSLHSLVEGVALGVESTATATADVLLAICAHKWFAAFALGVQLTKNKVAKLTCIRVVLMFSMMTPLGIIFGLVLTSYMEGAIHGVVSNSIKSFASGTFIYVGLVEVIIPELDNPRWMNRKLCCMFLGGFGMAVLALWT